MQLSVEADLDKLTKSLKRIEKTQLPFATKGALDATAFDYQRALKKALPIALHELEGGLLELARGGARANLWQLEIAEHRGLLLLGVDLGR